jgi:hypothetical protein
MGAADHNERHGLGQGAQPLEERACGGAEGLLTRVTDAPLCLLRLDTDSTRASLATSSAVPLGTEWGCGVHDGPLGFVWKHAKRSRWDSLLRSK